MKAVILAGGFGTRLAEETDVRPKPMVEIGGRPMLWHIMKHFEAYGIREFVVALGYKGETIKQYFMHYYALHGDMTLDLSRGSVSVERPSSEDWQVHLVDTGHATLTGGRIGRLKPYLENDTFMVTYGDGLSNVDLGALVAFHRAQGRTATVTAVRPPARFGGVLFDGDRVRDFTEKPQAGEGWINGGFMVFEPSVFADISGDQTSLEAHTLETLARKRELSGYRHYDFWQCVDTLRDLRALRAMWDAGDSPWSLDPQLRVAA